MKIRRVTLGILVLLTLVLFLDARYFGGGRSGLNRSIVHFEITPRDTVKYSKPQDFRRAQGDFTSFVLGGKQGKVEFSSSQGSELVVKAEVMAAREQDLEGWEVVETVRDGEIRYELVGTASVIRQVGVNYLVEVPAGMDVSINYDYGIVRVRNFVGYLDLNTRFSQVTIDGLEGSAKVSNQFGSTKLQRIAGPLTLEDSYSSSSISLVPVDGGYRFDLEVSNGSLGGNAPVEQTKERNFVRAQGTFGAGIHPIIVRSSFSTVNVDMQ